MKTPQAGTKGNFRVYNLKTGKVRYFKTFPKFGKGKYIVTDLNYKEGDDQIVKPASDPPGGCPTGCRCTYLGGGTWLIEC